MRKIVHDTRLFRAIRIRYIFFEISQVILRDQETSEVL